MPTAPLFLHEYDSLEKIDLHNLDLAESIRTIAFLFNCAVKRNDFSPVVIIHGYGAAGTLRTGMRILFADFMADHLCGEVIDGNAGVTVVVPFALPKKMETIMGSLNTASVLRAKLVE